MPDNLGTLKAPRLAAAPSAPVMGQLYYDTTTNKLYWWNGTAWIDSTGGAAGGAGVDYIGNWAAGTAYKKGDVVRYNNNDYLAVNDSTGSTPPAPAVVPLGIDSWLLSPDIWTFYSADAPSYYISLTGDRSSYYWPGMRFKCTHAGVVKYFIITESRFISGITYLTLYGGTDYTLAAGTITLPYVSTARAPQGFPLDPSKWTVRFASSTNRQSTTINAWVQIETTTIPVGLWNLSWSGIAQAYPGDTDNGEVEATLSTITTGASDHDFSDYIREYDSVSHHLMAVQMGRQKIVNLTVKTPYYLIMWATGSGANSVGFIPAAVPAGPIPTLIEARSAYL